MQVGIVGCGGIVRKRHLPALVESPSIRVKSCFDVESNRAEDVANRIGSEVAASYEHLLADEQIEAVLIAAPPPSHYSLAVSALSAGKHVLVEKPLSDDLEQAEKLVQFAEASGRVAWCGFQKRYAPVYRALKAQIEAPDFTLTGLHVRYCAGGWPNARACLLWHFVHGLDLARYFAGEVVRLRAYFQGDLEGAGAFHILLAHEGARVSSLYFNTNYDWKTPLERVEAAGMGEYLVVEDLGDLVHFKEGRESRPLRMQFTSQEYSAAYYEGFLPEWEAFAAACRQAPVEVLSAVENGLRTQRLAFKVLESIECDCEVRLE